MSERTETADTDLVADCDRCLALCCVLLPFRAVDGFGADKDGGTPCTNLLADDRCGIHHRLREDGWPGCTAFDCFGAGQQVSQVTYAGRGWRAGEQVNRGEMAAVLTVMRQLHEMLSHLREAAERDPRPDLAALRAEVRALTAGSAETLLLLEVDRLRARVGEQLARTSRAVREAASDLAGNDLVAKDLAGSDLAGKDLRGADLAGADLRGSLLIAADLRGLDLCATDLLGADLRDADVRGTDLSGALYLRQAQLNTTRGDRATVVPTRLEAPAHWSDA